VRQKLKTVEKVFAQAKKTLLVMLAITVMLGLVKFWQIRQAINEHANFKQPPEAVLTTIVKAEQWREVFQTVGSCSAVKGATLGTQESGNVARVGFESGARVLEGQVLLELDRSVEEANLQGALARLELAKQNLARAQTLKGQSAISLANYEDAQARLKQSQAEVLSIRGVIERKTITAPFAGRAGIRAVNVGQYVTAGTPLVPLYAVDPVLFNFSVPQHIAPVLKNTQERVRITVDAYPGRVFEGSVTAVNPNVNEITRSVEVQATIPNQREELSAGMFGEVAVEVGEARTVVAIPVSSVEYAPYGNSVYVVERSAKGEQGEASRTVRQQIVKLGARRGDFVSVVEGLTTGDEVVTLGTFKLRPGARIVVMSDQAVPASLTPVVKDS
jgi:membrane fusion protein (multidrug efflux system)